MGAISTVMARKLLLKFKCEFCRSFVVVEQSQNRLGNNMYQINLGLKTGLSSNLYVEGQFSKLFDDKRGCQGNLSIKGYW